MDTIKRLKLEFPGIKDLVYNYTDHRIVLNSLEQLEKALETNDGESIIYCVDTIVEWYSRTISEIHANSHVFYPEAHDKAYELLNQFKNELREYDFLDKQSVTLVSCIQTVSEHPLIFISHRSSDKKYGDALAEFITGLGVKRDQLIYTSSPLHKIPLDKNIYEFLRENIHRKMFMIILWSNEYLDSPACLNEMGAAWVVQCDYTNIYTPTFLFGNPKYHQCAVDTRKMGAVLRDDAHCRASMIELKNKILELFELSNDEVNNDALLNRFMQQISAE